MKLKLTNAIFLGAALATGPQIAQAAGDVYRQTKPAKHAPSASVPGRQMSHQPVVRLSKLMQASIESRDGQSLGRLEDILINPGTGQITFAVVGKGGFLGLGERHVPVPWQAVNMKSDQQLTVNVDSETLRSAPALGVNSINRLYDPAYTVTIHEFYSIPFGAADLAPEVQTGDDYNRERWESDYDTSDDLEDSPLPPHERLFDESEESDYDTSDDI